MNANPDLEWHVSDTGDVIIPDPQSEYVSGVLPLHLCAHAGATQREALKNAELIASAPSLKQSNDELRAEVKKLHTQVATMKGALRSMAEAVHRYEYGPEMVEWVENSCRGAIARAERGNE